VSANELSLTFLLRLDGSQASSELQRLTANISSQLAGLNKPNDGAAAAAATAVQKQQADTAVKIQKETDAAVLSLDKQRSSAIVAEAKAQQTAVQSLDKQRSAAVIAEEKSRTNAVLSLQKQRSSAILSQLRADEKARQAEQKTASANNLRTVSQTAASELQALLKSATQTANVSSIASQGIKELGDSVNVFVGQRIPLFGGAFLRVTDNLRNFSVASGNVEASTLRLGKAINSLAVGSGKTAGEIKTFLTSFKDLGTQAEKDSAAIDFFGATAAQKLLPALGTAEAEMSGLTAATAEAGTGLGALIAAAGPVGLIVAGIAVNVGILVVAMGLLAEVGIDIEKRFLDLAKSAAGFRGEMVDLSQQVGVSTETLSAFEIFAKTTGGDLGSVTASLGIFQKELEEGRDPTTKAGQAFSELSVDITDTESALRQTFTALAAMPEGFHQTAIALELFGRGGKSMLAILKEMHGDIDGAIEKLRKMGLVISREDAVAADRFNDELAKLEFKFRALVGKEVIPAATDAVEDFSKFIDESHNEIQALNDILGLAAGAIGSFTKMVLGEFRLIEPFLDAEIDKWNKLADAIKAVANIPPEIPALEIPDSFKGLTPVPLPRTSDLDKAREEARLVQAEIDEAVRFANGQVDAIDRQLKAREIAPATALEAVIATEKEKTRLVIEGLEKRKDALNKAFVAEEQNRGTEKGVDEEAQRKRFLDAQEANDKIRAAEDAFRKLEADKRAEFRAQELEREQAHRRAKANIFNQAIGDQIASINRSAEAARTAALVAADATAGLLEVEFAKRREVLEREREEAGKDPALVQKINDQFDDLQRERTAALQQQAERRIEIIRNEAERGAGLQQQDLDTAVRLIEITRERLITSNEALAAARIQTEEEAAKKILKLRLDANQQEIELAITRANTITEINRKISDDLVKQRAAAEKRLQEAGTITDPAKRLTEQTDAAKEIARIDALRVGEARRANKEETEAQQKLNNDIKILKAERATIQANGDRDIQDKRQKDLENNRHYNEEIKRLEEEVSRILRDTEELRIESLVRRSFDRRVIIQRQADLDRSDEEARHKRAQDAINQEREENSTAAQTQEQRLEKERQINVKEEAERERHAAADAEIEARRRAALEREDPLSTRSLFGDNFAANFERFRSEAELTEESVNNLSVAFSAAAQTAADFFEEQSRAAGNFSTIAGDAIRSFTDGLNQMITAWVLTGETGPAALRKLTAQVLAQVAAQAAVKAIFELAEGFALLFVNPAASASHFTAAAIFGSIAGVTAAIGRKAAGDLFKQPSSTFSSGSSSGSGTGQINPVTLSRNSGTGSPETVVRHEYVLKVQSNDSHILEVLSKGYRRGGAIREIVLNDGGVSG
jgi:hypothetical protein